jgi:acyl-coenzyme A thioesterase PaaI-like protein
MAQGYLSRLRLSAGWLRFGMNLWPPFLGAGIHVLEIAPDFRRVVVRLRRGMLNRNYFGTHYGGSLFSMTDPFYALMLLHNLERGYIVWDKAAAIRFKAPGRSDVFARFELTDVQIAAVVAHTAGGEKYEPTWPIDIVAADGQVIATVEKTLHIRRASGVGGNGSGNG